MDETGVPVVETSENGLGKQIGAAIAVQSLLVPLLLAEAQASLGECRRAAIELVEGSGQQVVDFRNGIHQSVDDNDLTSGVVRYVITSYLRGKQRTSKYAKEHIVNVANYDGLSAFGKDKMGKPPIATFHSDNPNDLVARSSIQALLWLGWTFVGGKKPNS